MKTAIRSALLTLIIALAPSAAFCDYGDYQYVENQKDILYNLEGVYVFVKTIKDRKSNWPFDIRIQDEVEHQIAEFGINVLSETDVTWAPGRPILKISVDTTEVPITGLDVHAFSVIVSLQEAVVLERDMSKKAHAVTWQRWSSGVAQRPELEMFVRQSIKTIVDTLIDEYLAGKQNHPFK